MPCRCFPKQPIPRSFLPILSIHAALGLHTVHWAQGDKERVIKAPSAPERTVGRNTVLSVARASIGGQMACSGVQRNGQQCRQSWNGLIFLSGTWASHQCP